MATLDRASQIRFVVNYIRNPDSIKDIYGFIDRLVRCKHEEFIEALMHEIAKCDPDSTKVWVCCYLHALVLMLERPYRGKDANFLPFVEKLILLCNTNNTNRYEAAWHAACLLGKIDHPKCNSARIDGIRNDNLFIDGRIACLRGIVDFHPPDEVREIVKAIAEDRASPMHDIANLILPDLVE